LDGARIWNALVAKSIEGIIWYYFCLFI
jgi:threonine aldolase